MAELSVTTSGLNKSNVNFSSKLNLQLLLFLIRIKHRQQELKQIVEDVEVAEEVRVIWRPTTNTNYVFVEFDGETMFPEINVEGVRVCGSGAE